ncbi:MAG TPA: hypothetical protein VII08_13550 [Myxococcales bacterium]
MNGSEIHFEIGLFAGCPVEGFDDPVSILGMNVLEKPFEGGIGLRQGNGTVRDVGLPSKDAFECRVAALDGLIPAEQRDPDRRGIQNRLQFGGGPPQFRRPFRHLCLELTAGPTKVLLGS